MAIGAALLAFALGPGVAGARVSHKLSKAQARRAVAFWTPARMARARPLDRLRRGSPSLVAAPQAAGSSSAGSTHVYPPTAPADQASASSATETVPDPTAPLARTNGVVFMVTPFGLGRCSGTSVNAPNHSVVLTAGHCIDDGTAFSRFLTKRWVFVPGYRYGQRPFGVFAAKWLATTRQWHVAHNENYDVGAAVVSRNERGQLLSRAVGGTGIAWGLKPRQVFDVHGYPVEPPFDGETQQACLQTPFLGHDPRSFFSPGPLNLGVECETNGGSSGGGWTIRGRILNGVTTYGYEGDPSTDFGPYFGREVGRLYVRARRVR
ncbi:MAG: trypsin-like serine peptidase [Chloroflexota bacterium]